MIKNKIIVGIGEILWDIFPDLKVLGGAPANFAYHISQFGFDAYAVSAVGDDLLGEEIIHNLNLKQLKAKIEVVDKPTGTVQVKLNSNGLPSYDIIENVAWDNIPFSNTLKSLAEKTDVVCFGSLAQRSHTSQKTIIDFISSMPDNSIKIFDINLRQKYYTKEIIENSFEIANMVKINDDELNVVANIFKISGSEKDICTHILKTYNLDTIILTKGTEGSIIMTPEQFSYKETHKVQVADTVGAGDSFTAAFIAAYINKKNIENAHQLAVDVSAYVCLKQGAMPKLDDKYLELF